MKALCCCILILTTTSCERSVPSAAAAPPSAADSLKRNDLPTLHDYLRARMDQHREAMEGLLQTAIMLDFVDVERHAHAIAKTPTVPDSLFRTDPNQPHLPGAFHKYEKQLTKRAKKVAQAARQQDAKGLARSYGALTETCIGCHALFLDSKR